MRFPPKVITVCFGKKVEFNHKSNHGYSKLANFRLDTISKINSKTLVIMLYTLSELGSRKVQPVWKVFKKFILLLFN